MTRDPGGFGGEPARRVLPPMAWDAGPNGSDRSTVLEVLGLT